MYINFAGITLSDFFEVKNIEIPALPKRENISINIPSKNGEIYNGFKYNTREITIDFLVKAQNQFEYSQAVSDIANALDVNAPSRLYLNDSYKYFYAVPNDSLDINEIASYVGEGQITFICYEPMQYSDEYKIFEGTNNVTAVNEGTTNAYPVIRANFSKDSHFVQVTNSSSGQSILVGEWPNIDKNSQDSKITNIADNCESTSNWTPAGNVVDSDRLVEGAITINSGGYGIKASNFGTTANQKWHGPAVRRNLNTNIQDFEVVATFEHDSKGTNKSNIANTPASTPENGVEYITTANLNVRNGRGTSHKVLTTMPKNHKVTVTDISGGWGKVTYKSKTGYSSMQYLSLVNGGSSGGNTHKVDTRSSKGLNMRAGKGNNYKIILSIPNGTQIKVTENSSGWAKTSYKGSTGYVSSQYITALKSAYNQASNKDIQVYDAAETADDKVGIIELYGFSSNNQKLFKLSLNDINNFYEYTWPEIQIGNNIALQETANAPAPIKKTEKDDKGNDIQVNDLSGKFGSWNEFYGNLKIKRTTVDGKHHWQCEVNKIKDNKVVKTLKSSVLVSDSYPKEALNHLVLYIGAYQDKPPVEMTLTHISVNQLNKVEPTVNQKIFKNGDELEIDCSSNMVYLNSEPFMKHLDIGSQFFDLSSGETDIKVYSDDDGIFSTVSLTERWL